MSQRTRLFVLRAAALSVAAVALAAGPASADDQPLGFIDGDGVEYDEPHQVHGGFQLTTPVQYCEDGQPMIALRIENVSQERVGYSLHIDQGTVSEQDEMPVGGGSLVSVPAGVAYGEPGSTELSQLLALVTTTMPEVNSYIPVAHDGTCEGKPVSQEEAFALVSDTQGEVLWQFYRAGSTTENPDQGHEDGGTEGAGAEGAGAEGGSESGTVSGPRIQTGTAAPSGAAGVNASLYAAAGLGALLTAGAAAVAGRVTASRRR